MFGKFYADKGYISKVLFERMWCNGVHLVTGLRSNMKNKLMGFGDKIMLRKRSIIETINDSLKNARQIVHSRHRSLDGFLVNVLSALVAYCCFDKKPAINIDFEIEEDNTQIRLF